MPPNARTRRACTNGLEDFVHAVHAGCCVDVWDLSTAFLKAHGVDDPAYQPLADVVFCKKTNRYRSLAQPAMHSHPDDFILTAIVMWNLIRLEHGEGREAMLRQLSIWEHTKKKPKSSTLPNLWEDEISQLQRDKKLGKGLAHHDNFDMFCSYYAIVRLPLEKSRWNRRSETQNSYVHIFAEQAAVQWAIEFDEKHPHYADLAAGIVRTIFDKDDDGTGTGRHSRLLAKQLPQLLLQQATTARYKFCEAVMDAIFKEADDHEPRCKKTKTSRVI
jgi:hypothetical protein